MATTGTRAVQRKPTVRVSGAVGQVSSSSLAPSRPARVTPRYAASTTIPTSGWTNHGAHWMNAAHDCPLSPAYTKPNRARISTQNPMPTPNQGLEASSRASTHPRARATEAADGGAVGPTVPIPAGARAGPDQERSARAGARWERRSAPAARTTRARAPTSGTKGVAPPPDRMPNTTRTPAVPASAGASRRRSMRYPERRARPTSTNRPATTSGTMTTRKIMTPAPRRAGSRGRRARGSRPRRRARPAGPRPAGHRCDGPCPRR